jgi:hypothetical protein
MRGDFTDEDYPEDPYPGARPPCSYVHVERVGHAVTPASVDGWLTERSLPGVADRFPMLAYGSNANPAKITWLRDTMGLPGPVVVLRVRCTGLAAVWATHLRVRDVQRPATLMAEPGRVEWHAVWLATPEQIRVLDRCEGRGERYRLVRLDSGTVTTEDGAVLRDVLAYVAMGELRAPLLVDGAAVRCADMPQEQACDLAGVPGDHELTVCPVAEDWP